MTCHNCRTECKRNGKHRNGLQRFKCQQCGKRFTEPRDKPLGTMYTPVEKAEQVLGLLLEGCSVSAVERLTEVHHTTILTLLVLVGEKCARLFGQRIRNVPAGDVQCDEIWGFVQKKEGHKRPEEKDNTSIGDAYCYVAIERKTKLVLNIALGRRNQATTDAFIEGLRAATSSQRFQLTTDGFQPYVSSITTTLSDRVDYATQVKVYANLKDDYRYSPGEVTGTVRTSVMGAPDLDRACTSHVERQNLTMRMQMRRLTRLTNGFSKNWDNHWAALCLYFAWYNFVRVHRTLRTTPAMAAGLADHVWSIRELLALLS